MTNNETSNKSRRRVIITALCAVLTVISLCFSVYYLFIGQTKLDKTVENSFELTNYTVEINVGENAILEVQERMTAVFYSTIKRGIVRGIPLTNTYSYKENGTTKTVTQSIEIFDLKGNALNYEYEDGWVLVNFGEETDYLPVDTPFDFTLKYKVNLGKDTPKTYDMFYYNILGIDWTCNIKNFDFTVTMPKSFENSKTNLYTGTYGKETKLNVGKDYNVDLNTFTITGNVKNIKPHNAITLSIGLEEGYFVGATPVEYKLSKIALYLACVCAGIAVIAFLFKGRRPKLVIPVEFYAPDDMNPAEVASIYKGKVDIEDTTSLIVWFASKKYLRIEMTDKEDIVLTKLKEYPIKGKKIYEKMLFDKLFEKDTTINLSKVRHESKTVEFIDKNGNTKSTTVDSIPLTVAKVTEKAESEKPVKKRLKTSNIVFAVMCLASVALTVTAFFRVPVLYRVMSDYKLQLIVSIAGLILLFAFTYFVFFMKHQIIGKTRILCIIGLIVTLVTTFINILVPLNNISYTLGYINWAVATVSVITVVIAGSIIYFTEEQVKYYGRVIGFRNFILNCEKEKMDLLLKDNPEYFYDILPYAYVFGITEEFISRFESLGYRIPLIDTYYMGDIAHIMMFNRALRRTTTRISTSSRSAISETKGSSTGGRSGFGGGGFSGGGGGGFSGGGFGGGGGRSR